jgi:hypothetical protein
MCFASPPWSTSLSLVPVLLGGMVSPSHLFYNGEIVCSSDQGVQQGDPLEPTPVLYRLAPCVPAHLRHLCIRRTYKLNNSGREREECFYAQMRA